MTTMPSMRTPIARVRGLGSAKSGTSHFWLQRLTGLANAALAIGLVAIVMMLIGKPYEGAVSLISHPLVSLILLAAVISAAAHMRIGMQVIIEDYVHGEALQGLGSSRQHLLRLRHGAFGRVCDLEDRPRRNSFEEDDHGDERQGERNGSGAERQGLPDHRPFLRRRRGRRGRRGLRATVGCAEAGLKTACITKVFPTRSPHGRRARWHIGRARQHASG